MLIIRNIHHEMPPPERKPRRPERIQHRLVYHGHALGLLPVPQMLGVSHPLVIRTAHDRPGFRNALSRLQVYVIFHSGEIRGQYCHFVVGLIPLSYDVLVPILDEDDVRIGLHGEVLSAVETMAQMTSEDGTHRQFCFDGEVIDLGSMTAGGLVVVLVACSSGGDGAGFVFSEADLVDDADADSFGAFGAGEGRFDGEGALPVSVGGYGYEYCF
mmetsp:Transcript_8589/g.17599  ORF Transcript_8589/g.17599 Transcript_8589/m.17599 type:complete len:214 (+) Transcript_8589:890-1531(+)